MFLEKKADEYILKAQTPLPFQCIYTKILIMRLRSINFQSLKTHYPHTHSSLFGKKQSLFCHRNMALSPK